MKDNKSRGLNCGYPAWVVVLALVVALSFVAPTPAQAQSGCQMSAGPSLPTNVSVGQSVNLTYAIQATSLNTSNAGDCEFIKVGAGDSIFAVYSCGSAVPGAFTATGLCPAASVDPGVFSLPGVGATAAGAGACAGITFTVTGKDAPSGELTLTASATFTLQSINYGGAACTLGFASTVLAKPTKDSQSGQAGTQTNGFGFATGTGFQTNGTTLIGSTSGSGTAVTTVGTCAVNVDKQVSCDGTTWFDVTGLGGTGEGSATDANNSSTLGPICAFGSPVHTRFVVKNTGDFTTTCTNGLTDSNSSILPGASTISSLASGAITTISGNNVSCNLTGSANGNNTATLSGCTCSVGGTTVNAATVTDTATYACCGVQVDKQISCDGTTFTDVGFGDSTTSKCTGKVGSNVAARWFAQNQGNVATSCTLADNNTTFNTVAGASGTFSIPAGTASQQVSTTYTGLCQVARATEIGGTDTASLSCTCTAPAGLTNTLGTLTAADTAGFDCCGVSVDKQVSCDGGATWLDQGFSDGVTQSCNAVTGNNVDFRYFARNNGSIAASCGFTDTQNGNPSNVIFNVAAGSLSLPVSGSSVPINASSVTAQCTSAFGAAEPNTGSLSCTCSDNAGGTVSVSDTDTARVNCQAPALTLTKVCDPQSGNGNAVTLTAQNTGQVPLTSCTVTDTYFTTSPTCPPPGGATGTALTLPNGGVILDASMTVGAPAVTINATALNLTANTCNTAHLDCLVDSTATHITADANDVCEVQTGCFTRTIGYWGTHPDNTLQVLQQNGGGVLSCGLNLTTVDLSYLGPFSTSQDLCSNGQDSKGAGASPEQTSLVRQCAGAAINLAASKIAGLGCGTNSGAGSILAQFNACCGAGGVCATGGTVGTNTLDSCNTVLDAFNNQFDNQPLPSFIADVPANPQLFCQEARGDGKMNTGAGRTYK